MPNRWGFHMYMRVTVTNEERQSSYITFSPFTHHLPTLSHICTHAHKCACVHTHTHPHTHTHIHYTYTTTTLSSFTLIPPCTSPTGNTWHACETVHCTLNPLAMANSRQPELYRSFGRLEIPRLEHLSSIGTRSRRTFSFNQHDMKIVAIGSTHQLNHSLHHGS